ncbi:unnamed protein product [Rangifer tarandus platyrhynchus]|uniref:Uncharacterized protein n=1 Tax=Rangifer tarandus platyrhynchus TaxID=3082113 RepID=A0AC59ZYX2_RANTA
MSSSNCCFLTCIQISQEAAQVVWYSHLFQNFPQFLVIHTVKGFGIVNKPGNLAKGLRTPREFDCGGQCELITQLTQGWGNRVLEGTNKTSCAPGPRRKEQ